MIITSSGHRLTAISPHHSVTGPAIIPAPRSTAAASSAAAATAADAAASSPSVATATAPVATAVASAATTYSAYDSSALGWDSPTLVITTLPPSKCKENTSATG